VNAFGTVRLPIGYAPGNWLFYATGGLAWIEDQQLLTVVATGATESPNQCGLGWSVAAGVEIPFSVAFSHPQGDNTSREIVLRRNVVAPHVTDCQRALSIPFLSDHA